MSTNDIPSTSVLMVFYLILATRPKKFKPEKKIMEPEFYEALKKRKNTEQEMKAVLYDFFT